MLTLVEEKMKRVIIYLLLSCCSAMAVEYGYFARSTSEDSWSDDGEIILYDGDVFVYLSDNVTNNEDGNYFRFYVDIPGLSRKVITIRAMSANSGGTSYFPEDARSLSGPCTITLQTDRNETYLTYKIIRAAESAAPSDSQYSASLNADGTRLAIGEQQGTNTSSRVYEYNDLTGAWEQLGDSVE